MASGTSGSRVSPGRSAPDDITGVVVHSDLRRLGWFSCSDDRVSRLHEAVVWSLRSNMCDIPTDCPQRERAGWTGDWQIFAPTAAYLYDVLAFTRKWLGDVSLDQRADGCVANISPCPPAEGFDGPLGALNGSAGWGDVVVSAPWDLYQAYGDTSLLSETWGTMTAWVGFAAAAAAGGRHPDRAAARPVPAAHERYLWDTGFHWGEWLEPGGAPCRLRRVRAGGQVRGGDGLPAPLGGDRGPGGRGARAARGAVAPVPRRSRRARWTPGGGSSSARTEPSPCRPRRRTCGRWPSGWCRRNCGPRWPRGSPSWSAWRAVTSRPASCPRLTCCPSSPTTGTWSTAYELLLQDTPPSWLTMVDRGATTVWEEWEGVDGRGVPHASLNHYSKGAVASFLHRYVAGLRPAAPGYRTFEVRPRPGGGITSATARHISPFGPIEVSWRLGGGSMELDVLVPPGTTATVVLPGEAPRDAGPGRHRWTVRRRAGLAGVS